MLLLLLASLGDGVLGDVAGFVFLLDCVQIVDGVVDVFIIYDILMYLLLNLLLASLVSLVIVDTLSLRVVMLAIVLTVVTLVILAMCLPCCNDPHSSHCCSCIFLDGC